MKSKFLTTMLCIFGIVSITLAQKNVTLKVEPSPTIVEIGKDAKLTVLAFDDEGNQLNESETNYWPVELKGVDQNMIFTTGIKVDSTGVISATQIGEYDVFIFRAPGEGEAFARTRHKITVINQPVGEIKIVSAPSKLYQGAMTNLAIEVIDKGGAKINNPNIEVSSSNQDVVVTDNFLNVMAQKTGKATITVKAGELSTSVPVQVVKNPVDDIALSVNASVARTGDVLKFSVTLKDSKGASISDVPYQFSVSGAAMQPGSGSSAMIDQDGRFVAEKTGSYIVTVSSGNRSASKAVQIGERNMARTVKMIGQGSVSDQHTSDLWVWEGSDGRDYAVTGTWGSDGKAYFWDVTDPAAITKIDSVQVDARTVNDVKVSEDGKICIISREGASNRKNGIIIIDVANPRDVQILSEYTERLTGGVHNLFIYQDHVYALSNGEWYEVINIEDPKNPKTVSQFKLPNSGNSIHDVWIVDGIAYSSNWTDGIVMVDVGNGVAGGSPDNPVEIARAHVDGDANHAAFPYKSKDTGKFYVIAGDEIFPLAAMTSDNLQDIFIPSGYLHFMDMTDPNNPKEVARYEVPEAGSHNFWVEDDLLYIGYYNGGLRVVDISGDLMGDLYKQGREVAKFIPYDADGFIPNNPFVWGAQPHKGHIFFSDFNSGLWSAKVEPVVPEDTKVETK